MTFLQFGINRGKISIGLNGSVFLMNFIHELMTTLEVSKPVLSCGVGILSSQE
jgi:hypothetical protein